MSEQEAAPQTCNNAGCKLYKRTVHDGSNCLEFTLPQQCEFFHKYPPTPLSTIQEKPSRAQELVDAHWGHYVGPLLKSCGVAADLLPMLEFMYKSSGIHFYKHAMEDQQEVARQAMKATGL